eukprot:IDg21965t1
MIDGTEIPIIQSAFKKAPTKSPKNKTPTNGENKTKPTSSSIRIAKNVLLSPKSQTFVSVVTERRGTIIIEPKHSLASTHLVSASNGVAQVKSRIPFEILIANFGTKPVRLHKGQIVGNALALPVYIGETTMRISDVLKSTPKVAIKQLM